MMIKKSIVIDIIDGCSIATGNFFFNSDNVDYKLFSENASYHQDSAHEQLRALYRIQTGIFINSIFVYL